jgi:hypothetical protein
VTQVLQEVWVLQQPQGQAGVSQAVPQLCGCRRLL